MHRQWHFFETALYGFQQIKFGYTSEFVEPQESFRTQSVFQLIGWFSISRSRKFGGCNIDRFIIQSVHTEYSNHHWRLNNLINFSLSHNRLLGSIPNTTGNMISLEELDLSHNNLSGSIPKSLEALKHLKTFNVSYNSLSGEIPPGGPFVNFTRLSFMFNKALCGLPRFEVPPCPTPSVHRSNNKILLLALTIALGVLGILAALILALIVIKYRKKRKVPAREASFQDGTHGRISYYELLRATDGYNDNNLLGRGSFGAVYKGVLDNGTILAVKVFNLEQEAAFKSFDAECKVLRNLRHRNLTRVISSCSNHEFKALVLEYMPNGSLEQWLHSDDYFLDTTLRLNIMIDVASALEYLHHGLTTAVVHCDLKPSNVLLDEDMVAHLSDFGIAKLLGMIRVFLIPTP
ncbi:UNVERIFIED_CONTAM: Receptor kinase-like protein Xa21 [Sesamum calycinum]|uniref:Receptor kinase-like protein Xa21 n=1 Tax=Sesamum calycinum TaxID=2727403 RepID=A0AAW2R9V3_9LAMI